MKTLLQAAVIAASLTAAAVPGLAQARSWHHHYDRHHHHHQVCSFHHHHRMCFWR